MRSIVEDAFECDELVYQFTRIDVEDGLLKTGSREEVNETYSDDYIIAEAENRLSISSSNCVSKCPADMTEMERTYWKERGQLDDFIFKYKWEAN